MKYEIYQDKQGGWRWRLTAANGEIVAAATEGFANKHEVNRNAVSAALGLVRAMSQAEFQDGLT